MAKKMRSGSSGNQTKPSRHPKHLGVKVNYRVKPGMSIVLQHGMKMRPGINVKVAKNFTIYSTVHGIVKMSSKRGKSYVSVTPDE